MKIFISWSDARSRAVAEALREWLPNVIQALEPWISSSDIGQGARWAIELATELQEARIGIICLTPENLASPWILFEAGALSKTLENTFVCPYLIDLKPSDLTGPLAMFQAAKADLEGTRRLLHSINKALPVRPLLDSQLDDAVGHWWPDFEERLRALPPAPTPDGYVERGEKDMLEELIGLARAQNAGIEETVNRSLRSAMMQQSLAALCGSHIPYPQQGNPTNCSRVIGFKPYMARPIVGPVPDYVLERHHFEWRGFTPPAGHGWSYSSVELDYLLAAGRIGFAGSTPVLRVYPGDPNY